MSGDDTFAFVKALLVHRGTEAGVEHHLDVLIAKLADGDAWKAKLKPFEGYSPFAAKHE